MLLRIMLLRSSSAGGLVVMALPRFSLLALERRRTPREPKHQIVRLKFDDDSPWIRGMLNNLSVGGACLSISTPKAVPAEFNLILPPNILRRCRLVWRAGETLGVEFLMPEIEDSKPT